MSVSVNCKVSTSPPVVTDAKALLSPDSVRKSTKKHQLFVQSTPSPSSPGGCSSNSSGPISPSGQTKLLHHFQKPLKKFSLASAFPPGTLSKKEPAGLSPRSGSGGSNANLFSPVISPTTNTAINGDVKRCVQEESNERKFSSPLDYRDSGVYLGETRTDPVLEMLNMRKQRVKSPNLASMANCGGSGSQEEAASPLSVSSASQFDDIVSPLESTRSMDTPRDQHKKTSLLLTTMDSCKSLPSMVTDGMARRTCSGENSAPSLSDFDLLDEESLEEEAEDEEEEEDIPRPRSSLARVGRNSSDDLLANKRPPTKKISLAGLKSKNSEWTEGITSKAASLFVSSPSPFSFRKNRHNSSGDNDRIDRSKGEPTRKLTYVNLVTDPNSTSAHRPGQRMTTRASFFRRSRSLTGRDVSRTKRRKEQQIQQLQNQHNLQSQSGQRQRTGSTGDEYERTTDTTIANGRTERQRKISQPAMVRFQIENEPAAFEDRKANAAKKKRSFADPIAKKLSFLRRRPTDSSLVSPSSDSACISPSSTNTSASPLSPNQQGPKPPTKEEVRKWATSFEDLLSHPYGAMLFRLFLQREFSEENIDFWMACEEYKRLRDNSQLPCTAKQIYSDFVAVQAPKEVNLDSVTRSITAAGCNSPTKNTFEQAQHRIQSLMEKDSYPRFLRSDLYLDLVKKA